jgi:hypothetical protein
MGRILRQRNDDPCGSERFEVQGFEKIIVVHQQNARGTDATASAGRRKEPARPGGYRSSEQNVPQMTGRAKGKVSHHQGGEPTPDEWMSGPLSPGFSALK